MGALGSDHLDEKAVRDELTRVFDVCHGCRRCIDLCPSFPTLFDLIDAAAEGEAGALTPAQQDVVIDRCHHCTLCLLRCPYAPDRHELAIDVPRLMLRAEAMRHATGQQPPRRRVTTAIIDRAGLVGAPAPVVGRALGPLLRTRQGSIGRRAVAAATGVSAVRLVPPAAKERFSRWFANRTGRLGRSRRAGVTVFPTCLVEYHEPGIGKDLVRVYERNGIECSTADLRCCGAPWLHVGDLDRFTRAAERNVRVLAAEVRRGREIVAGQPTCGHVLRQRYVDHVGADDRDDAALVAEHTHDAAEFLVGLHDEVALDTEFPGEVPDRIVYHVACHLGAQDVDLPARTLMELTGATVTTVEGCSGIGTGWGLREEFEQISIPIAARLGDEIRAAGGDGPRTVVVGDCTSANTAIAEQTGARPRHPFEVLARAYGMAPGE